MVTCDNSVLFGTYTYTSFIVTDKESGEVLGEFRSLQSSDALYVFSGKPADFFNNIVQRVLKKLYPTVLFAFIHSNEIYNILEQFEKKQNVTLNHDRVVRKVIFGKQPRTQVDWDVLKKDGNTLHFNRHSKNPKMRICG